MAKRERGIAVLMQGEGLLVAGVAQGELRWSLPYRSTPLRMASPFALGKQSDGAIAFAHQYVVASPAQQCWHARCPRTSLLSARHLSQVCDGLELGKHGW